MTKFILYFSTIISILIKESILRLSFLYLYWILIHKIVLYRFRFKSKAYWSSTNSFEEYHVIHRQNASI